MGWSKGAALGFVTPAALPPGQAHPTTATSAAPEWDAEWMRREAPERHAEKAARAGAEVGVTHDALRAHQAITVQLPHSLNAKLLQLIF